MMLLAAFLTILAALLVLMPEGMLVLIRRLRHWIEEDMRRRMGKEAFEEYIREHPEA